MIESPQMHTRRALLMGSLSALVAGCVAGRTESQSAVSERLAEIESQIGGKLGVHVLDTESQRRFGINDDDRFAMCSTFKLLLAGAVLAEVDAQRLSLDRSVAFGPEDMVPYAPVTSVHLAEGAMTVHDLCAAIVEVSDNPAANILLPLVGGPPGLNGFLRGLGDTFTRLDRLEPELNTNVPGDPRDTTTPRAMVHAMEKLLIGAVLSDASRGQLIRWLVNCKTGLRRIRAGLPGDWKTGDKTGTGMNGAVNDVSITWPTGRKPCLIAVYASGSSAESAALEAVHANVGNLITRTLLV